MNMKEVLTSFTVSSIKTPRSGCQAVNLLLYCVLGDCVTKVELLSLAAVFWVCRFLDSFSK